MNHTIAKPFQVAPGRRLAYTLVGLLAGDGMLLFFLLQHALHGTLLLGEPGRVIADSLQMFFLYATFSFAGWLLVGLPAALIFPADSITRLSWPLAVLAGAALGPLVLFVIFLLFGRSHVYFRNLAEIGMLLGYSILVSTVSLLVYLTLLRKQVR